MAKAAVRYKPLPLQVEDCNLTYSNSRRRTLGTNASSSADVEQSFSANKERSKLFTGRKNACSKTVPTLFDSCIRILSENIDNIEFTGGVPFDILKPVLEKASFEQLYRIEEFNKYLSPDTGDLWKALVERDFKNIERVELESWRELYERGFNERERKLAKVTSHIDAHRKAQGANARKAIFANIIAPRDVRRRQGKVGIGSVRIATTTKEISQNRREDSGIDQRYLHIDNNESRDKSQKNYVTGHSSQSIHNGRSTTIIVGSHKESGKKRKAPMAPLMAKTLKMVKMARR